MKLNPIFNSKDVKEVYEVYNALNEGFLKNFKYQAEFRITTTSFNSEFVLSVEYFSEIERKWLEDKVLEISSEKVKKTS
jgi:hypothetical protein